MNKESRVSWKGSISTKLYMIFGISALIPMLAITMYAYTSFRDQSLNQAYERLNAVNVQISNGVNSRFEATRQISNQLFRDATLNNYLIHQYDKDYDFVEAYYYINELLYSLLSGNSYMDNIAIYAMNDTLPSDGRFILPMTAIPFDRALADSMLRLSGDQIHVSPGRNGSGVATVNFMRPLNYNPLSKSLALLSIALREDSLYALIRTDSTDQQIYLTDESGRILSCRDKSLLGKSIIQMAGEALPKSQGRLIRTVADGDWIVVHGALQNGIRAVSLVKYESVLADAARSSLHILIIALFSVILAIILITLTSHNIVRRFRLLRAHLKIIENQDFTQELPPMGNDELGRYAISFNHLIAKLNQLINELYKKELMKKDAELYALQSQINPHFLYNTLSAISSLAIINNDPEVSNIVQHLSRFYQTSLSKGKRFITVDQELSITRNYLAIQHLRFRDLFIEHWEIDEDVLRLRTLKLMLQPFVENAIDHALSDDDHVLNIWLRGYRDGEFLCLEIEDDGVGMAPEIVEKLSEINTEVGYGIYNVHERIQLAFGDEYGVKVDSQPMIGTKISLQLPLSFADGEDDER